MAARSSLGAAGNFAGVVQAVVAGPDAEADAVKAGLLEDGEEVRRLAMERPGLALFLHGEGVVGVGAEEKGRLGTLLTAYFSRSSLSLHGFIMQAAELAGAVKALANKLARIAWAVLAKGRAFELPRTDDAGVRPA